MSGLYKYKGWIIERTESGHWNMRPMSEREWCDAANTLQEAKDMITRFHNNTGAQHHA